MKCVLSVLALMFAASCGQPAASHGDTAAPANAPAGVMHVESGWAGPTPNGVDVSAGYVTITNATGAADRLLSATSPRARDVQLHEMSMDSNMVMQMRQVSSVDVPAGATVALGPGGKHLMFTGVTQPFTEGEQIPVTLTFEHAGAINTSLTVSRAEPAHH